MKKSLLSRSLRPVVLLAAAAPLFAAVPAAGQEAIRIISHRQPALEYYTSQMAAALPEGEVNVELMPIDRQMELASIAMSSQSDSVDVVYLNDSMLLRFAKNGWLEPLDDLWEKYRDEYNLDDFPQSVIDAVTYDGHIYAMPIQTNVELFFYRGDVLEEAGIEPPTTMDEYAAAAEALHSPRMAGTIMTLKPVDATLNETHWYLNALGEGWFDEDSRPIFNRPENVAAIEAMKNMSRFAPRGFTAHGNDESTINLQQGLAAMGMQWLTRAAAMDNPEQSRVVGQIEWIAPPSGGARIANDGFAISAFSSKDREKMFVMLAEAASQASMREGAQYSLPPRLSVLEDPELSEMYRWYPAAREALQTGVPFPAIPDFLDAGEIMSRYILQAVTGELETQDAMDRAASEVESFLAGRGYYE